MANSKAFNPAKKPKPKLPTSEAEPKFRSILYKLPIVIPKSSPLLDKAMSEKFRLLVAICEKFPDVPSTVPIFPSPVAIIDSVIIPSPHKYSCVKTSKARLASLPRYLSGSSSALYAVRPVFVTKLYISPDRR
ncbi:hypothetical protein QUB11_12870 [Microcoleus sp. B6-A1]